MTNPQVTTNPSAFLSALDLVLDMEDLQATIDFAEALLLMCEGPSNKERNAVARVAAAIMDHGESLKGKWQRLHGALHPDKAAA